ncbi:MAG: glycoside hydrolase family 2 TIM barrel-domain containing protein, partial [Candidatus Paceibacteria bacterium]
MEAIVRKVILSRLKKPTAIAMAIFILVATFFLLVQYQQDWSIKDVFKEATNKTSIKIEQHLAPNKLLKILKDVGEPQYENLGLIEEDFFLIKNAGFDIIEGSFDICQDPADVKFFLDNAEKFGLKVIMNAGSGEGEWGYECDENYKPGQKPIWQKEKVRDWVLRWKNHPAVFAWDISNEAGANFPFGPARVKSGGNFEKEYALTLSQLQQAYKDVKSFDPEREIMIRMNGWYFYDYKENFFRPGNPFGKDVADIVMINAYSNVEDYYADFVYSVMNRAAEAILKIEPNTKIIAALGVWEEPPLWRKPKPEHLIYDYQEALKIDKLIGVAFF